MKTRFGPLMVRRAHHERMPGPFILSKSKEARAIFIASEAEQSRLMLMRFLRALGPLKDN